MRDINNITIEKMSEDNYKKIALLAKENLAEAWSESTFFAQLSNPNDCTFIAYCGGEPAGFISVWCIMDEAEINNIAVNEKFRRKGIAKALLTQAEKALLNAQRWVLEVRESNENAISLYKKSGFENAGMRKNFYSNPTENGIIMVKVFGENNGN